VDRVTRARIDSLLFEVRRFPERAPWRVHELGRRYCLDPMIVRGLLESEGVVIVADRPDVAESESDSDENPNQQTQVMHADEL
jgi:hypothetical protein